MSNVNLEGGECIIPDEDQLKNFFKFLEKYNKSIETVRSKLKGILIDHFSLKGNDQVCLKLIEKGLPKRIIIHGEKTTCLKNEIIFIQISPLVEKGTILLDWNELPKLASGGLVWNNENSEKVLPEITRKIKINEPHTLIFDGSKSDPEYLKNMQNLFSGKTSLMNYAKLNESKESFEMRKSILIRNPFPTIADTLPKEKGFVLTEKWKSK